MPMNGVLGMMEVLERQGLIAARRPLVATMRDSAQALLRIIDDLLDFSKIEAGRLELETTAFSLASLIEGAADTLRPQVVAKGLTLDTEMEPGSDDALLGDPTRVRQNPVQSAKQRGQVHRNGRNSGVHRDQPARWRRNAVTIVVADTDIGLDDEQQACLFQPFTLADGSTTRRALALVLERDKPAREWHRGQTPLESRKTFDEVISNETALRHSGEA